jgi:hypothetical protein
MYEETNVASIVFLIKHIGNHILYITFLLQNTFFPIMRSLDLVSLNFLEAITT